MKSLEDLYASFVRRFNTEPDGVWAAPGRVNLIGEHTDYNQGYVLPLAIDRHTRVAMARRTDGVVRVGSTFAGVPTETVTTTIKGIGPGTVNGWSAYPLGVVWVLNQAGIGLSGFDMLFDSDVPIGAGLSSSAAIECSTAIALNDLLRVGLTLPQLARIGQRAENDVVSAPTGIMDQSASLLGQRGSAVFLDCRSGESALIPFNVAGVGLELLVLDTKVSHSHATGGYAARRASCERGAQLLGLSSLRDLSTEHLPEAGKLLDDETFRRLRHVVTENERVTETIEKLRTTGPRTIGGLLDQSHRSMRDDFEISCQELDLAVTTAQANGALGARMTGGGFGGSAIALAPIDAVASIKQAVFAAFAAAELVEPEVFSVQPAEGARRLT